MEVDLMSSDSTPPPEPQPEFSYSHDDGDRLYEVREATGSDGSRVTTFVWHTEPRPLPFTFVHDKLKRLFILTWADGKVERFRDRPARQLMVEPDPETGEMRPVIKHGAPAFVYLCREEREDG
jgi:hypothetical protein